MEPKELAALLKRCAEEMNNYDELNPQRWKGVAGEWTSEGRAICDRIAGPVWGEICYYLLGGVWNDVLDWSERNG